MKVLLIWLLLMGSASANTYGVKEYDGLGSVFQMEGGKLITIYSFCQLGEGYCWDGEHPVGVVPLPDGTLIGTTTGGGNGAGTIFRLRPTTSGWQIQVVWNICWTFENCHYAGTSHGLAYVGLHHRFPLLEGTCEKKARGVVYRLTVEPSGYRLWSVRWWKGVGHEKERPAHLRLYLRTASL